MTISKSETKIGFSIVQNIKDIKLNNKLRKFLNCGRVSVNPSYAQSELIVNKLRDIDEIILPLFQNYNLIGIKKRDFEDFSKIVKLMKNKEHLTEEGLEKIIQLKSGMNRRRKITIV